MQNAQAEEPLGTKDRLIQAGTRLFSRYGYEATTTRMIAKEVGVNLNTIQFHFGGKENLYKCVLEAAAKDSELIYGELYDRIQAAKEGGALSGQAAWAFIEELVDLQLGFAIDQPKPDYLGLIYWEQMQPVDDYMPMTDYAQIKCEHALALLLVACRPGLGDEDATVLSRFLNGGIISFGEHPVFLQTIQKKTGAKDFKAHIKKVLYPFIMGSIEQYTAPEQPGATTQEG